MLAKNETQFSDIIYPKPMGAYLRSDVLFHRKKRKALKKSRRHRKRKSIVSKSVTEYISPILFCLENKSFGITAVQPGEEVDLIVPDVFCLSRNPDGSIYFLKKLYGVLMNYNVKKVIVDYSRCNTLGLCAILLMNLIMLDCQKKRSSICLPIEYYGKLNSDGLLSNDSEINSLLYVSGILKRLGITKNRKKKDVSEIEKLGPIPNGESAIVAANVIEYINRSLSRHGLELTPKGKNYFGKLLGEIVDNCHQHGGEGAVWYTLGFYNYDGQSECGNCRLVILDFGQTIYEGLKKDATAATKKRIEHYVRKSRASFFKQDNEELLYTLFSLQQRASRFSSRGDSVRGNGTVVFLDAFQNLFGQNEMLGKPLLSITSGKCSILFDGTYQLKEVKYREGYTNKIIAFNKENDLKKEPDPKYVRSIHNGFPGTIISIELHINNEHVSRKEKRNAN